MQFNAKTGLPGICAVVMILTAGFQGAVGQQLALEEMGTGFVRPLFLTTAGDDSERLFLVEQGGRILMLAPGAESWVEYLSIDVTDGGERGLLGLAFHPNFAENGAFFVNYTYTSQQTGLTTRIARYQANAPFASSSAADPDSEVSVIEYAQPATNHNGGWIGFSPNDGYLYIAAGDGGGGNDPQNRAQPLDSLLGKMLRINVDPGGPEDPPYTIPEDNPFLDGPDGARQEIWAHGLRNPYRSSFDRLSGDLYIADVGQNAWEEINFQAASSSGGENYGWRVFEADRCNQPTVTEAACNALADEAVFPVHSYPNPDDGRSVTGGYVYRGSGIPAFQGRYFFADFVSARVWSFIVLQGEIFEFEEHTSDLNAGGISLSNIASFGEDEAGELYIVSIGGTVYRLVAEDMGEGAPEDTHSADQNGDSQINLSELLRVIQLFNSPGLQCAAGTEDGYAVGMGDDNCVAHSSDYNPQDWQINLSELLRAVQFFNSPGFGACPEQSTEDGFCVLE